MYCIGVRLIEPFNVNRIKHWSNKNRITEKGEYKIIEYVTSAL